MRTFHVETGEVRLRLCDGEGEPVAGVAVELRTGAGGPQRTLPVTDDDGVTRAIVEPTSFEVTVLPERLQDREAQVQLVAANPGDPDPFRAVRLRLGEVTAKPGATTAIELSLPPDWDR